MFAGPFVYYVVAPATTTWKANSMLHNKPCSWASNKRNNIRHVALNLDTHQILGYVQRQFVPAVYMQRQVIASSSLNRSPSASASERMYRWCPLYFFTVPFRIKVSTVPFQKTIVQLLVSSFFFGKRILRSRGKGRLAGVVLPV